MIKRILILTAVLAIFKMASSQSCSCYINVDSTFKIVPMPLGPDPGQSPLYQCGACSSAPIKLPFSFCFYGKSYDTVYINTMGCLSFGHPVYSFSSKGFPAGPDTMMLAPLWAKVYDSLTPGEIFYKITPSHLTVQWNTVGYQSFDCDLYDNFQVVITNGADTLLPAGNNVAYCYWLMKWQSGDSSGGSGGFGGIPAAIGVNEGDGIHYAQFGIFNYHGYDYYGPYDSNSELYWMENRSFEFNTCVTGNTIPPVIVNPDSCHNFTICAGDTFSFSALFLNSEKGQKSTVRASAPGLSGLTADTVSGYSIDSITMHVIAALADTGAHLVTVTATDNSLPPLTNTAYYLVTITNCDTSKHDTASGIRPVTMENSFSVYPNPSHGIFKVEVNPDSYRDEKVINKIEIDNVLGEEVYNSPFTIYNSQFSIDLSSQPKGIYFIKLFSGNRMTGVGKAVIQ